MIKSLIRKNDEDCEPLVMNDCLLREDSQEMESVTHLLIRIQIPVMVQTRQKKSTNRTTLERTVPSKTVSCQSFRPFTL